MNAEVLSEQEVAERRKVMKHQLGLGAVLSTAARMAAATAAVGLPTCLVLGVGSSAGSVGMLRLFEAGQSMEQGQRDLIYQGCLVVAVFCTVYAVLQFFKRETARRETWFPALFALPFAMVSLGFYLMGGEFARQMPPAVIQPLVMGWTLAWSSVVGAWASVAWIRSGHDVLEKRPVNAAAAMQEAARRTIEISAVHGGRIHAVTVGAQVIVPGIFYALSLAFADMVAVLDPERRAMKRSGDLTMGMRSRIFRVFLVVMLVQALVYCGAVLAVDGQAALAASIVDFSAVSPLGYVLGDLAWALASWFLTLCMLVMYREREEQVAAKLALRRHERATTAGTAS